MANWVKMHLRSLVLANSIKYLFNGIHDNKNPFVASGEILKKEIILPTLLGILLTSSTLAFAGEPTELIIHKFKYEGDQSLVNSSVDFQPWTGEPVAYTLYQLDPNTIISLDKAQVFKELNLNWERAVKDFHLKTIRTNVYLDKYGKAYMEKLPSGCYVIEESVSPKEPQYQSCRWFFWLNGDQNSVDIYMKNTGKSIHPHDDNPPIVPSEHDNDDKPPVSPEPIQPPDTTNTDNGDNGNSHHNPPSENEKPYHSNEDTSNQPIKTRSWSKPQHVRISQTGDIANIAGYGVIGLLAGFLGLVRKKTKKDN